MNSNEAADILGVSLDATREEIARAYRAKARTSHPDRFVDLPAIEHDRVVTEFRLVREARDLLIDRLRGADRVDLDFSGFVAKRDREAWTTNAQRRAHRKSSG